MREVGVERAAHCDEHLDSREARKDECGLDSDVAAGGLAGAE